MRMGGVRVGAAGLLVAAGLVLAGCTGSAPEPGVTGSPTVDPTPAVSASPSPSVPVKPERPDAMKRDDAKGAAAAAEYFLSLYAYTKATGDTTEWDAMSHRLCDFCRTVRIATEEMASRDESYTGGEVTLDVIKTYLMDEVTGIYPLDGRLDQASATVRDAQGQVITTTDGAVVERRIEMGIRDNKWVVVTVAPLPEANQ